MASLCDWRKNSRHCLILWKEEPKPMLLAWTCAFHRALSRLHVIASNSDWLIALFRPVVIGWSNCFGLILLHSNENCFMIVTVMMMIWWFSVLECTHAGQRMTAGDSWARRLHSNNCYECSCTSTSNSPSCHLVQCLPCDGVEVPINGKCCPDCHPGEQI